MPRPEGRDPDQLLDNTAFLVMDVGRLLRMAFDRSVAPLALSRSEWWLLTHLAHFNGSTQQELADLLDLSKGGLAKLIERMERRGLVRREAGRDGGRANKRVFLGERMQALAQQLDLLSARVVAQAVSLLDATQVAALHEGLRAVRQGLLQEPSPAVPQTVPAKGAARARTKKADGEAPRPPSAASRQVRRRPARGRR